MTLTDDDFRKIIRMVTERTGNQLRESYIQGLRHYIERKQSFDLNNPADVEDLINETTVNETYFFREERQFDALGDFFFPEWKEKHGAMPIKIWSAASSTGEEIYSIASFVRQLHINAELSASDINTSVLEKLKSGIFPAKSARIFEGETYRNIINMYKKSDNTYEFPLSIRQSIKVSQVNLLDFTVPGKVFNYPVNQNIIFIRNVFIYFDREIRRKILKGLAEKALAKDGYLFVSISEVASFDAGIIPSCLEKIRAGGVFCFHKKNS